jgi:hypothetical protein
MSPTFLAQVAVAVGEADVSGGHGVKYRVPIEQCTAASTAEVVFQCLSAELPHEVRFE